MYRVTHLLADWVVGLTLIWDVTRLVGRYCSYLLPKQAGGNQSPQIKVNPTEVRQEMCHPVAGSLTYAMNERTNEQRMRKGRGGYLK